jgi:hypothetical protein
VPQEEVVEVAVDVIEEAPAVKTAARTPARDEAEPEERPRKKKDKKKKRDKDWAPTLEERLARRDRGSWRKREVRRGWKFLISGFCLVAIGILLSICLHMVATADPTHATTDYGILSLALRTVGVSGPTIGLGIAALIPIGLGLMNFLGFGIVVEERDD